jgi:hypothetical protein
MPRLSSVFCDRGTLVVPEGPVTTNVFSSLTESLAYWPAGNNQVLIAARIMTSIKMEIGLGKNLLLDMVRK